MPLPLPDLPLLREPKPLVVDRIVLDRKSRAVKLYMHQNRFKKHVSGLSEAQIKDIVLAIRKAGKKTESFAFDDEIYVFSPSTKRKVK